MQVYEQMQMQIPEQFPSNVSTPLLQSITKQNHKQEINYFQPSIKSILKNNKSIKSVYFKQNNRSISNIPLPITTPKQQSKGKNIQQFLQFQQNFNRQKQQNILKLRQIKNEEQGKQCTGRPSINSHSRKLTSQINQPYFQRLSKSKSRSKNISYENNCFRPSITTRSRSMQRDKQVSQILYNDALRRIQKQNVNQLQKNIKTISDPKINNNTDKLIIKTLKTEFEQLTAKYTECNLNVCLSVVKSIFNVDLKNSTDKQLYLAFTNIVLDNNKSISKQKLWNFAQIVMGMNNIKYFNEEEVKLIQHRFSHLYRFRMTKARKEQNKKIPQFRPQILKISQKLAQKKRSKLLQQAERMNLLQSNIKQVAVSDLYLMERAQKYQTMKNKKIEQDEQKQAKQCTFKPVLTNWKGYKQCQVASTNSSRKRTQHLKTFSRCQNTNQTLRSEYSSQSIKYNQLTGRNSSRKSINQSRQKCQVKNLQLSVQRMSAGRQQRQFSNQYHQRGYPQNIDNYQSHRKSVKKSIEKSHQTLKGHNTISNSNLKSSAKSNSNLNNNSKLNISSNSCSKLIDESVNKTKKFIFDIHINTGVIETINLQANDNPHDIVLKLTKKHNLDQQKKQKLFDLICYYINKEVGRH